MGERVSNLTIGSPFGGPPSRVGGRHTPPLVSPAVCRRHDLQRADGPTRTDPLPAACSEAPPETKLLRVSTKEKPTSVPMRHKYRPFRPHAVSSAGGRLKPTSGSADLRCEMRGRDGGPRLRQLLRRGIRKLASSVTTHASGDV